jgi:hypothetical protein
MTPAQVIAADPSPLAVVEALQAAVEHGRITPKLAREMMIRLVPPKKPTAPVEMPSIVDAASYAEVCKSILTAAGAGQIAPSDATSLLRSAKTVFAAVRAAQRMQK